MKGVNWKIILFILFSMTGYFLIAHVFDRSDFWLELSAFGLCFVSYFIFNWKSDHAILDLFLIGLVFRLIFIWGEPKLSDDYYRFIWDARLIAQGEDPYSQTPNSYFVKNSVDAELQIRMNSPDYYSIYPPIHQYLFLPSGYAKNVEWAAFVLHLVVLVGELFLFYFLIQITEKMAVTSRALKWIWLNPLWIIEINGNLHFEGWMSVFILIGILGFIKNDVFRGATGLAVSVSLKMVPLFIVPAIKKWKGFKTAFSVTAFVIFFFLLGMYELYDGGNLMHFSESMNLYFSKFEFNASFYFILREIGFYFSDVHPITYARFILLPLFFIIYCILIFRKDKLKIQDFLRSSAWILFVYLLLATTIHPWYILPMFLISVLAGFSFGIIWSGLIFLSYSAYGSNDTLYYSLILLEYLTLFLFLYFEFRQAKKGFKEGLPSL